MDTRKLKAFIVLAETLNFHKAAGRLYITQPALTKQIHALEDVLGGILFSRGPEGTVLTEFGKNVFAEAKVLLEHISRFKSRAQNMAKNMAHPFSFATPYPSKSDMQWINKIQHKNPEVMMYLINEMAVDELEEQLRRGRIQLAVMPASKTKNLESRFFFKEQIVIMSGTDVLVTDIIPAETKQHKYIDLDVEICVIYRYRETRPIFKTNDINLLVDMVKQGGVYAFVLQGMIDSLYHRDISNVNFHYTDRTVDFTLTWNPCFNNELTHKIITQLLDEA